MKLEFKTLKQESFTLDVELSQKVSEVKGAVCEAKPFQLQGMKLIFLGKILNDDETLADAKITGASDQFIVVMAKAVKNAPKKEEPKAAPTKTEPVDVKKPQETQEKKKEEAKTESKDEPVPMDESATNAPPSVGTEDQINQIMGMGFSKEQATSALRAAFGNAARAVEYLTTGTLPMQTDSPSTSTPTPSSSTGATNNTATTPSTSNNGGPPQPLSPSSPLYELLQSPQFTQIRGFVQNQPQMLPVLLQQVTREQPELVQLINQNREDFYNLLNTPVGGGGGGSGGGQQGPPGQQQIRVTPEENAAIDRLCAMGFEKSMVVQAYFACDKNEQMAANYLLEHGFE